MALQEEGLLRSRRKPAQDPAVPLPSQPPELQLTDPPLDLLVARVILKRHAVELWSDEHQFYPRAIRDLTEHSISNQTVSSKQKRTARNPLFPVNLLLRHTGANHKRETIAFSKRRQGALYRASIWLVWKNYLKSRSERKRDATPAQVLGICKRQTVRSILSGRLFPTRIPLKGWLKGCYDRRISTRCTPNAASFERKRSI